MRQSARAIIIRNKKLLLVTGHGAGFYWTPGGGIEPSEQPVDALRRELEEELNLTDLTITPFSTYEIDDQSVSNFIVRTNEPITITGEVTGYVWYGQADLHDSIIKISDGVRTMVIPELIQAGLL